MEGIGYIDGLGPFRPNPPLTGSTWDDLVGWVYRKETVEPVELRALAEEAALYAAGYTPRSDREWLEDVLETIDEATLPSLRWKGVDDASQSALV